MRENFKPYKKLNLDLNLTVTGLNQDRLIFALQKKGIEIRNLKKYSKKKMKLTISLKDEKNFFAITDKMCYNVKRDNLGGKNYPIYYLIKNIGLVIGGLIFIALAVISNDYIFAVEYVGTGRAVSASVDNFLVDNGVKKYTKFSSLDLKELSNKILVNNEDLTFVSCYKSGNRLIIDLALANNINKKPLGANKVITADVDGVIESIKVYRGTAVKKVGDAVIKGDNIVDGYATVKDQVIETNPIAYVSIIATIKEEYISNKDGEESLALSLATGLHPELEIISCTVDKKLEKDKFIYQTQLKYRYVIYR